MRDSLIVWILAAATLALGQNEPTGLDVAAKLQAKRAYVGQGVEVQAAVVAGPDRPNIEPPKLLGADLTFIGHETQAISVSAIGDQVNERTVHRFRYRLLPRKAGTIVIPPFRAILGKASGASQPLRLEAREVPREGRTGEFLGGVGTFELVATAKPSAIRLGQALEYRIEVKGTAARGIREEPSLERLTKANPGARVESLPVESTDEPPSRVFSWRIRPKSSGEFHLPPVAIAAFDPKVGVYSTKATAGIVARVADVPVFDPQTIRYGTAPATGIDSVDQGGTRAWLIVAAALFTAIAAVIGLWRYRNMRISRDVRAILQRFQRQLLADTNAADVGPLINHAVKEYLSFRRVQSTGALTPEEARLGVERLTSSSALGLRSEELLAGSDRLCFGARSAEEDRLKLRETAMRFLDDLIAVEVGSRRLNSPSEPNSERKSKSRVNTTSASPSSSRSP